MKKLLVFFSVVFLSMVMTMSVCSQAQYVPGIDAGFGTYLPKENGFDVRVDNIFYQSDEFNGISGYDAFNYTAYVRGFYTSPIEVIGATWSPNIGIPIVYGNVDANTFSFDDYNLGNIYVEPVAFTWTFFDDLDVILAGGFYAPTADETEMVTYGRDYWTGVLKAGASYKIGEDLPWVLSGLVTYEFNEDSDKYDIQFGDSVVFEYGIAKEVFEDVQIGITGYNVWQLDDNVGMDLSPWQIMNDSEVYAVGPEIAWKSDRFGLSVSAKSLFEFAAKDRSEGIVTVFSINKTF